MAFLIDMLRKALSVVAFVGYVALLASGLNPAYASVDESISADSDLVADPLKDLVPVWDCDFSYESWDRNYDKWPDRWSRRQDDEHPRYVDMEIRDREGAKSGRALVVQPDGASASVMSPPILVLPKFSYKISFDLKLEQIEHGQFLVRIELHDAEGKVRQVEEREVNVNSKWERITLEEFQPHDAEIDHAVLHFNFVQGERADLDASISLSNLIMSRRPSIKIYTDRAHNVYSDPEDVVVTCALSGILEQNPEIRFQLLDATNKDIGKIGVLDFNGKRISKSSARAKDIVDGFKGNGKGYEGSINWHPPISDYGFYRVRVQMISSNSQRLLKEESVTIAVVSDELKSSGKGEFGWSLPNADSPLSFDVLNELLPFAGVNMVKVPVWYAEGDEERGDALVRFVEVLAARGIGTVGVLEDPTDRINDPLWEGAPSPIAGLLIREPRDWIPLIDHVIVKLSLQIRWWQFGRDGDTSFVGFENLVEKIFAIRNHMFRFGQDIRLGIGWRWDHTLTWDQPISWDFEQMASRASTSAGGTRPRACQCRSHDRKNAGSLSLRPKLLLTVLVK